VYGQLNHMGDSQLGTFFGQLDGTTLIRPTYVKCQVN